MMFWIKNRKIHIDCFTSNESAAENFPIQKTSSFLPQWWKDLPVNLSSRTEHGVDIKSGTMKGCIGFVDLYSKGFVIPLWSDLAFKVEDFKFKYQFTSVGSIVHHLSKQYNNSYRDHVHFKINVPWLIREKTGVGFLMTSCIWTAIEKMPKLSLLNGVLHFNLNNSCNINGFASFENQPYQYDLDAGLPLVQLIPLSDKDVVIKNHAVTEQEYQRLVQRIHPYKFFSWGATQRRNYRLKSK